MFSRLLVPLDGSSLSERALPIATLLAQATGAQLWLVRAARESGSQGPGACQEAQTYLEGVRRRLGDALSIHIATSDTPPARAIATIAAQHTIDLIVMTTHGHGGLQRLVHGSVAEVILADSRVPVLLVRMNAPAPAIPTHDERPRVLVPLDGSPFAEAALPAAAALARALDWTLVLLRVAIPPTALLVDPEIARTETTDRILEAESIAASHYLKGIADGLQAEGLRIETRLRVGLAAQAILDEGAASGASLVIMATHGRSGLGRMLRGSVATEVLHRGSLPLLLVRPSTVNAAEP